jgi:hypothetical protein
MLSSLFIIPLQLIFFLLMLMTPSMMSIKRNEVDNFIVLVNGRDAPLKILALVEDLTVIDSYF